MTTKEAAKLIGCSVSYVKSLIAARKLKGKKVKTSTNRYGYVWEVNRESAVKFKTSPHSNSGLRGQPRKKVEE